MVYPGVSSAFRPLPAAALAAVRERLHLPAQFLLFVGTLEPRKNIPRLLEALALLPAAPPLVIAGRKGWLYTDIFVTLERLGLQPRVRFLDFVADADLPALYNLAQVFVYPSLYEALACPWPRPLRAARPLSPLTLAACPK